MNKYTSGWVVINIGHPTSKRKYIVESTFANTRAADAAIQVSDIIFK